MTRAARTVAGRRVLLAGLLAIGLGACISGDWQTTTLDLPGVSTPVAYLRRPMPNVWVGTEQYRRLRAGDRTIDLPVQMGGREPVNVYLRWDSAQTVLQLVEPEGTVSIDLETLGSWATVGRPDSLGTFVGALVSPEIRDLRFVPARDAGPQPLD